MRFYDNPYQGIVDDLEKAREYCHSALVAQADIPRAKGGAEMSGPTYSARSSIESALDSAIQWRDAFDYHAEGERTDF